MSPTAAVSRSELTWEPYVIDNIRDRILPGTNPPRPRAV